MHLREMLSKKTTVVLLAVLVLAVVLRLYLGALTQIPVWYDEGSYLAYAKEIGLGLDIDPGWDPTRTFFLPLLWGGFYALGANEFVIRLTMLLFSLGGVLLTFLLGKELFDERVGLLASFFMSVFWLHLFFTNRFLMSLPATTFLLAAYYFFWRGYVKNEGSKKFYVGMLFLGLAVFTRSIFFLGIIPMIVYAILKEKHRFLYNKKLWAGLLVLILVISPFFFWLLSSGDGSAEFITLQFKRFTGIGQSVDSAQGIELLNYLKFFPTYLKTPLLLAFFVGLISILGTIIIGYDLWFKDAKVKRNIFVVSWVLVFLLFFGLSSHFVEPRYLMPIFGGVFMISAVGVLFVFDKIKQFKSALAIPALILFVLMVAATQVPYASAIIQEKSSSYAQVKDAGLWIKENSIEGETVLSNSRPQIAYYSERLTLGFPGDVEGFEQRINELNPKFVMISAFEQHPEYINSYFAEHAEVYAPVHVITTPDGQPLVIIFERTV